MKMSRISVCAAVLAGVVSSVSFAQEKEAVATAVPAASVQKMGPITVTVDLVGGQKITGTLTEVTLMPIRTAFGEASVPLAEVAGVKLATAEDTSTTIIMKNGDSITGATDLKVLAVDTEWGSAKINGSSVASILLLPDLKWNATIGLNGKRWSLVDSKSQQGNQLGAPGASSNANPSASPRPATTIPPTRPVTNQ
jgi:hypothetical protein